MVENLKSKVQNMLIITKKKIKGLSLKNPSYWFKINGNMAKHGSLFLSFGLLLLAVKQVNNDPPWSAIPIFRLISPPSDSFSMILRIVHILISLLLIFLVFFIWWKHRPNNYLKLPLRIVTTLVVFFLLLFILWLMPALTVTGYTFIGGLALIISLVFMFAVFCRWLAKKLTRFLKGTFQVSYWMVFLLVFIYGYVKGLSGVPIDNVVRHYADLIGAFWFIVIVIIMYKAAWQVGKRR